jgi:large subunit ribosomal protein L35
MGANAPCGGSAEDQYRTIRGRLRAHDEPERKRAAAMPKMKTHSGAKKRFKVTGSGKLMHRKAGKMHLNEHKPSTRTRRLAGDKVLSSGDAAKARKLLGL